jgi:hypothetical protein
LILLNLLTIGMDILWVLVMKSVWAGKPAKNVQDWKFFDNIRGVTMFLSYVNILIKVGAIVLLAIIFRGAKSTNSGSVTTMK